MDEVLPLLCEISLSYINDDLACRIVLCLFYAEVFQILRF
jgi:hypothetical protein